MYAIIGSLRQFKTCDTILSESNLRDGFPPEVLMQKLERVPATQQRTNIQLCKDIEVLRKAVNKAYGPTEQIRSNEWRRDSG
jgi:hypothetical protein